MRKRFGFHEVEKGRWKGGLHYGGEKSLRYRSELLFHSTRLEHWILGDVPEYAEMGRILLAVDNVLEYEIEHVITEYVKRNPTVRNRNFVQRFKEGFVTFKAKYNWLLQKRVISEKLWKFLDTIHGLRNEFVHYRPISKRRRAKYFGQPLMSQVALQNLLIDASFVRKFLCGLYGAKAPWYFVPPNYAEEMNWKSVWPGVSGVKANRW